MSFLRPQAGASTGAVNPVSSGFGHMIGVDPSRVSMIANRIGNAANGIAAGGGAPAGYDGSAAMPAAPQPIDNHFQLLNPDVLRSIIAKFRPATLTGYAQ